MPASVVLARILHNMLPTDPELRQDWRLWQELWVRALRDETAQHLAVDLYDQLHTWIGQAIRRGIESGEFTDCDVEATSTLLLALSDGFGIRLMLGAPGSTSPPPKRPSGGPSPGRSAFPRHSPRSEGAGRRARDRTDTRTATVGQRQGSGAVATA